jgi:chromatin remodeling complex protein RSC6
MGKTKLDSQIQKEFSIIRTIIENNKDVISSKDWAQFQKLKIAHPEQQQKERKNTFNSGFNQRKMVSLNTSQFFNWIPNEPKSRNDITKAMCAYVEQHNLQVETNHRNINLRTPAGKDLANLLELDDTVEEISYPNLQKHTGKLFVKIDVPTDASVADVSSVAENVPATDDIPTDVKSVKKSRSKK